MCTAPACAFETLDFQRLSCPPSAAAAAYVRIEAEALPRPKPHAAMAMTKNPQTRTAHWRQRRSARFMFREPLQANVAFELAQLQLLTACVERMWGAPGQCDEGAASLSGLVWSP